MIMSVGIVMSTLLIFTVITEYVYRETLFEAVDQQLLTHKNMILNDALIQYHGDTVKEVVLLDNLRQALLTAFLLLLIVALILAFYLAKLTLKPLHKTYNKQVSFIQDASHEMRTPLAVIRGKMELMAQNSKDPIDKHFDELSHIMSEISGLEKMNKDLLLMSKEDIQGILEIKTFKIKPFLEEIVEIYGELTQLHDIYFDYNLLAEDLDVEWDEAKVKRCINILLENAIKYSRSGDTITLSIEKQDKFIRIKVADTGQGIKKDELPHIFDRFYRSGEVRASGIEFIIA